MGKYHKGIRIEGADEFLLAVNITGHGAPTEDTEAEPGMCYLDGDSEHGDLYKCIGVLVTETRTVYRWKKLAGQEEVERLSEAIEKKLDADKLPEAINTALAQAKESGEFDGEDGQDGKDGISVTVQSVLESTESGGNNVVTFSDGKTLTVKNGKDGSDYALTEADKSEIAEIAAGLVDVPDSGGGDKWEIINDFTAAEDLASIKITEDIHGNPFKLKKIMIFTHVLPCLVVAPAAKQDIVGFLSSVDAGISPHIGPYRIAKRVDAGEGRQPTLTFYAEELTDNCIRVNETTAYAEGASWNRQGWVNGLQMPQPLNTESKTWKSTGIDMVFAGSWTQCIGTGSRMLILGVRE